MKIKVLHIVGGPTTNGAYKGTIILHKALLKLNIESKLLNDTPPKNYQKNLENTDKTIIFINNNFFTKIINKIYIFLEKILKSIYLSSSRSTFTLGYLGFDITKIKEYKDADIIHIHWLNQGFIRLKSLSKIDKPVVWTMRDMWAFTGGSHYSMDFEKYETTYLSRKIKNFKKKIYKKNFQFIAISDWLKNEAQKSFVLKDHNIKRIYNNIDLKNFNIIDQNKSQSILNISTKKQIILYGAQNPQAKRKGWQIFIETLKKLDTSKYYLLIFGKFWSQKTLDEIGIEYKSLGFIDDKKILNTIYSSADFFIASSIQEAFGKTWAEAMACGTPIICFKNTPASEIIDHKINGYIVDNYNSDELLIGINWLSNEIKGNENKKDLTRNKIINFDAEIIAKKYVDLYGSIFPNKKNIINVKKII
ncbi:glycosyltransferase [Candidatus Pelagibacter sp.]|nr:glycosyltransferase [Candidatus Pelagibacter sp.]